MVRLNSNSVAVDEIKDVKKAEKIIKKWKKFLDTNIKNKSITVEKIEFNFLIILVKICLCLLK